MLKKILIFCLVLYSIFFVTVKFYIFPHYYKQTALFLNGHDSWKKLSAIKKIDYLVVGTPMVLSGIAPLIISKDSYSIAMPAGSLMDVYNQLKKTDLSHVEKGIIISGSFFFERNYENDYWDMMVQLGFYDFMDVLQNYQTGKEHQIFPYTRYSKSAYFFKYLKYSSFFNPIFFESLITTENSISEHQENLKIMISKMNKAHGYISYPGNQKSKKFFYSYRLHFNKPFFPTPTDDFYLKKILELTKNHKIYFIQLPLAEKSHPKINVESYKNGLSNYIESLTRTYPHLRFYDPKSKFFDDDFYNFYTLNTAGSLKLSFELKEYFSTLN